MELSGQLYAPAALPPGERAPYTYLIESCVGSTFSQCGRCGDEKNPLILLWIEH
jgi:hypothetical protein